MTDRTVLMQLAAPSQAWHSQRAALSGDSIQRGPKRDRVAPPPTLSGIVGLLGCAMGRPRADARRGHSPHLADLRALDVVVRVDQPGRSRQEFRTSRRRSAAGVVVQPMVETVLDDAVFLVGIGGPAEDIDGIAAALRAPRWAPYLGRREFPPSRPLLVDVVEGSAEAVVRGHPWIAGVPWRESQPKRVDVAMYQPRQGDERESVGWVAVDNPVGTAPARRDWLSALG